MPVDEEVIAEGEGVVQFLFPGDLFGLKFFQG